VGISITKIKGFKASLLVSAEGKKTSNVVVIWHKRPGDLSLGLEERSAKGRDRTDVYVRCVIDGQELWRKEKRRPEGALRENGSPQSLTAKIG